MDDSSSLVHGCQFVVTSLTVATFVDFIAADVALVLLAVSNTEFRCYCQEYSVGNS